MEEIDERNSEPKWLRCRVPISNSPPVKFYFGNYNSLKFICILFFCSILIRMICACLQLQRRWMNEKNDNKTESIHIWKSWTQICVNNTCTYWIPCLRQPTMSGSWRVEFIFERRWCCQQLYHFGLKNACQFRTRDDAIVNYVELNYVCRTAAVGLWVSESAGIAIRTSIVGHCSLKFSYVTARVSNSAQPSVTVSSMFA